MVQELDIKLTMWQDVLVSTGSELDNLLKFSYHYKTVK